MTTKDTIRPDIDNIEAVSQAERELSALEWPSFEPYIEIMSMRESLLTRLPNLIAYVRQQEARVAELEAALETLRGAADIVADEAISTRDRKEQWRTFALGMREVAHELSLVIEDEGFSRETAGVSDIAALEATMGDLLPPWPPDTDPAVQTPLRDTGDGINDPYADFLRQMDAELGAGQLDADDDGSGKGAR